MGSRPHPQGADLDHAIDAWLSHDALAQLGEWVDGQAQQQGPDVEREQRPSDSVVASVGEGEADHSRGGRPTQGLVPNEEEEQQQQQAEDRHHAESAAGPHHTSAPVGKHAPSQSEQQPATPWGGILTHLGSIASTLEPLFHSSASGEAQESRPQPPAGREGGQAPLVPPAPSSDSSAEAQTSLHWRSRASSAHTPLAHHQFTQAPRHAPHARVASRTAEMGHGYGSTEETHLYPTRTSVSHSLPSATPAHQRGAHVPEPTPLDSDFASFRRHLHLPQSSSALAATTRNGASVQMHQLASLSPPAKRPTVSISQPWGSEQDVFGLPLQPGDEGPQSSSASYGGQLLRGTVDWLALSETLRKNGLPTLPFITQTGQSLGIPNPAHERTLFRAFEEALVQLNRRALLLDQLIEANKRAEARAQKYQEEAHHYRVQRDKLQQCWLETESSMETIQQQHLRKHTEYLDELYKLRKEHDHLLHSAKDQRRALLDKDLEIAALRSQLASLNGHQAI